MSTPIKSKDLSVAPRRRAVAFWVVYLGLAAAILMSYASLFRPLWLDEAIHFALSGQATLGDLLWRLHNPDPGFLTRQTGFYQVLNFLTLQVTGANWLALRLPSILSAGLLIWAVYAFLRCRDVSRTFQIFGLIAVAGLSMFMYYAGEARPYMPYAATTIGLLAYFTASEEDQTKGSVKWLGWLSLYLGALFHLYFLITLPIVLVFGLWYRAFIAGKWPGFRQLVGQAHLGLVGTSVGLALVLGWLTWLRPQTPNVLDPFAWSGGSLGSFIDVFIYFHLQFLPAPVLRTTILVIEVLLLAFLLLSRKHRDQRQLFASVILFILGISTSLLIAATSVLSHYAIGMRQLVAGPPIVALALVWQLWILTGLAARIRVSPKALGIGAFAGIALFLVEVSIRQVIPGIPQALFLLANIFFASLLCVRRFHRASDTASTAIIAFIIAGGLLIGSQASPLGSTSPWWGILSLAVIVIYAVTVLVKSQRTTRPLTLSSPLLLVISLVFSIGAISTGIERQATLADEYSAYQELTLLVEDFDTLPFEAASDPDWEFLTEAQTPYGPGWAFAANANALRGGPVWRIFREF